MYKQKGFTIIELLVVLAIIAILLAIIRPSLTTSASKTREFECKSHLQQLGMAVNAYVQDWDRFPRGLSEIDAVLQDRTLLRCTGTSAPYYYHTPARDADRNEVIAACVDPKMEPMRWPHWFESRYLTLTAGGSVQVVRKR